MSRNINVPVRSDQGLTELLNTNTGKLIFTSLRGRKMALLLKDNRLIAAQVLTDLQNTIGAVYICRVQKYLPNIRAYFVEIAPGTICFLPASELCPGQSLKTGDEIPVQIIREAQKTKQPTVTAKLSISNKYAAISLGSPRTGYSNKLSRENKAEIASWIKESHITDDFTEMGLIVRTAAQNCDKASFLESTQELIQEFRHLIQASVHQNALTCLRPAPSGCQAVLETLVYDHEYREIITDDREIYGELKERADVKAPIRLYEDSQFTLTKLYGLESKLETGLERCVWLKSGAYLVIEPTEALTVIDVNSGKFEPSKHKGADEQIYEVNREAAEEIAIQLRLRNLSGMILVDFINMNSEEEKSSLIKLLTSLVSTDRFMTKVVDITALGLMEITRKKISKPLAEQFAVSSQAQ